MKLDRIPKLNKFENQMTQLNESKVRGFEWILVILRRCNLHFSLNINILLLKYNMKYKDSNELFKYKTKINLIIYIYIYIRMMTCKIVKHQKFMWHNIMRSTKS